MQLIPDKDVAFYLANYGRIREEVGFAFGGRIPPALAGLSIPSRLRTLPADNSGEVLSESSKRFPKENRMVQPATPLTIPNLLVQLRASDPAVRLDAVAALGRLGREARPAVPAMTEVLADANVPIRKMAALVLGDLGRTAKRAIPALIEALHDDHEGVRRRVVMALGQIGTEDAVPALKEALEDSSEGVRKAAAWALELTEAKAGREAA